MRVTRIRLLEAATIGLFAVSVGWWLIVFGQVIANTGMAPSGALPCLVYTSDRCSLAMALCKDWHFLGIKRYFAEPIWLAMVLSLFLTLRGKNPASTGKDRHAS